MPVIEQIISVFAPHSCVDCGAEGQLLCVSCAKRLQPAVARCYRCHKVSATGATCKSCRSQTKLARVQVLTAYEGVARRLVWQLKFGRARAGAVEIGRLLAPFVDGDDIVLVPVPTATSRVRQRGYDQAVLIARALSRAADSPFASLLIRRGQHRQVGMSRARRQQQLKNVLYVRRPERVRGAHIILVDDVITTGATLEAATAALKAAGAKRVEAIVFAQA